MNNFITIYEKCVWGKNELGFGSSGFGSTVEYNYAYINFLREFIKDKGITKVVDIGSGDFQLGLLLFDNVDYVGYDIYPNLSIFYKGFKFICLDVLENVDILESGDLMIIKDVFQHWCDDDIIYFLEKVKNKYILVINDCIGTCGGDIITGNYRPLSYQNHPLNLFNFDKLLEYNEKEVLLLINDPRMPYDM